MTAVLLETHEVVNQSPALEGYDAYGADPWLRAAVSKTLLPFILVLLFFTLAGYAMQRAVPEARSIGGFWQGLSSEQPPQR